MIFTKSGKSELVVSAKSLPIRNEKGKVLSDSELINYALDEIDKFEKAEKKVAPVPPKFIHWLKKAKESLDKGEKIEDIKAASIYREIPDYSLLKNIAK